MVDVTEGLRSAGPVGHPAIVAGYVSNLRPAPRSFDDPVWVVVPSHAQERVYGPCAWPASHGNTIPSQGTEIWLGFDNDGSPLVLSWAGSHS